jgi:hypothetical protein
MSAQTIGVVGLIQGSFLRKRSPWTRDELEAKISAVSQDGSLSSKEKAKQLKTLVGELKHLPAAKPTAAERTAAAKRTAEERRMARGGQSDQQREDERQRIRQEFKRQWRPDSPSPSSAADREYEAREKARQEEEAKKQVRQAAAKAKDRALRKQGG